MSSLLSEIAEFLSLQVAPPNFIFEVLFRRFSVFLENIQILIDSKATKCRNNADFGSKKMDFWHSQEYRLFELEIHHYSFLLEFVEFLDEMKTPEIKKNMKFGHHKYHLSQLHLHLGGVPTDKTCRTPPKGKRKRNSSWVRRAVQHPGDSDLFGSG